ncbi:MAG: polysaccharide deacetylase family protein [Bacteroidota bacterium]
MRTWRLLALVLTAASGACAQPPDASSDGARPPDRTIALTVDDLPVVRGRDLAHRQRMTRDLVRHITTAGVPAVGFVNEGKLDGEREAQIDLLRQWVEAGLDLGNHTYGHPSLFDTPLATYQDEVRRGDVVTNRLLAARGDSVRYFRHPYLNVGPDLETRRAFEDWLSAYGLAIAPVTHDNTEWIYAFAYDRARDDAVLQARIADAYLAYMDTTMAYYETLAQQVFGREIAHVLLIHANALNADHLDRLIQVFRQRGYRFVTLDEALADPAYASEDAHAGRAGISWLQRWAIHREVSFAPEPVTDSWVEALTNRDR